MNLGTDEETLKTYVELLEDNKTNDNRHDMHGLYLAHIIIANKFKNVIELGVRDGRSTKALLYGVKHTGGHLTSVDVNETPYKPEDHLAENWTFHRQDALNFLNKYDKKIDFIFVDDWHAEDHVFAELSLIHKLVEPSSLITLHDAMWGSNHPYYNEKESKFGEFAVKSVYGALQRFVKKYPEYEFSTIPINQGLTILRKTK